MGVLEKTKIKVALRSNPIALSNHLPTFAPNEEYISLLKDLHKETNRSKEVRSEARIGNLRKELIKIEVTLTSEQIIFNTKLAIQEQPKIVTKTKYKL